LADSVVILSLLLAAFAENLAFLRIVRALRLLRSYHLLRDLRAQSPWFRLHEDIIQRTVNLGVFMFIVTSVVYVTQHAFNPKIASYVDALYFTIITLTTTGFGDITLIGTGGRLLAVVIMFVCVGLFLRLLQAIPSHKGTLRMPRLRLADTRCRRRSLQALRAPPAYS
jgi:voltage-gated potassium channel